MDDIDIGVDSFKDAKQILKEIDLVLQTRQVRLNSGKTVIMSKAEAEKHFKVRENIFLDKFVARINSKYQSELSLERERRFTTFALEYGFRNGTFIDGNGEKILKRLITIAARLQSKIPPPILSEITHNWPGAREHIMRYYAHMPYDKEAFQAILSYIGENRYVDDVSWLNFAKSMVSACTPRVEYIYDQLGELFDSNRPDFFEVYAKIWILSKYGNSDDLLSVLKQQFDLWASDDILGRLVGGLFPLFEQDGMMGSLERMIVGSNNRGAKEVLSFHRALTNEKSAYVRVRDYLRATNPTLPNHISHPKYLMLLTVLQGYVVEEEERKSLIKVHHKAFSDGFYGWRLNPLV